MIGRNTGPSGDPILKEAAIKSSHQMGHQLFQGSSAGYQIQLRQCLEKAVNHELYPALHFIKCAQMSGLDNSLLHRLAFFFSKIFQTKIMHLIVDPK